MGLRRRDFMVVAASAGIGLSRSTAESLAARGSLDAFVTQSLDQGPPGIAGAVVVGDRLAWSNGYGWADVSRRIPMTDTTLLNVGSVSKTVTATAIMQLWEAGRLSSDWLTLLSRTTADTESSHRWAWMRLAGSFAKSNVLTMQLRTAWCRTTSDKQMGRS